MSEPFWIPTSAVPAVGSVAEVATTVAGLGTPVDGSVGLLRLGSTPFDFLAMVYDATLSKWVGPEAWYYPATTDADGLLTQTDVIAIAEYNSLYRQYFPYKIFKDAGLSMQLRLTGFCRHTSTEIAHFKLGFDPVNLSAAKGGTPTWSTWELLSNNNTTEVMRDSGWQAEPTVSSTDLVGICIGGYRNSGGTSKVSDIRHPNIGRRWVST